MARVGIGVASGALALLVGCDGPVAPTSSTELDQLVGALRQQGLTVAAAGRISPSTNGFFSVPADQLRVNDTQVSAFVYSSTSAAAAEAEQITEDAQPSPTARVSWVSTPHFYRQERLIVLYVGCAPDIVDALDNTVGPPVAVGRTPCGTGK